MTAEIIAYLRKTYPDLSETNIKLLVAQAKLESGNYTSNFYKNGNNLFGILYIGQRFANGYMLRQSDGYKFAKYNSYIDSINDRMRIFYALYPDILRSDDSEKIIDTWLYSYLGRNASSKTKNSYKGSLYKLSGLTPADKKKSDKNGLPIILSLIGIILIKYVY
jgi:hypothetical protein